MPDTPTYIALMPRLVRALTRNPAIDKGLADMGYDVKLTCILWLSSRKHMKIFQRTTIFTSVFGYYAAHRVMQSLPTWQMFSP